jgi:hypothetical protein
MSRRSPERSTPSRNLRYVTEVWRGSYPVCGSRHRRSRSQTRSSARRHSFEQNLCRGDLWYAGTLRNIRAGRRNNQKKFMADYPRRRGLAGRFFPVPHALPVAPALGLPLFLTRRHSPVLLLGLPLGPLPRLLSTRCTAVTLRGSLRMKGLLTPLQQTHARPRPACWMHASGCLLIFGSVCRTFRKAHGRYSSQKLMPRRGTSNSSPGRSSSFTDRGSRTGSTRRKHNLSQLTPQRAGLLSALYVTATKHWRPTLHWSATMDHPHSATDIQQQKSNKKPAFEATCKAPRRSSRLSPKASAQRLHQRNELASLARHAD